MMREFLNIVRRKRNDQKSRMMMNGDGERGQKYIHKCIQKATNNFQQEKAAQWNRIEKAEKNPKFIYTCSV